MSKKLPKCALLLIAILSLYLLGCNQSETQEKKQSNPPTQEGIASFYAKSLKWNLTVNGERFNPNGFTAAHRTLPLGTKLLVTNLANNKSIVVRINDRGPYIKDRIIDLSPAVAKKLEFFNKGITRVRLKIVYEETPVDGKLIE